jgi:hypothetical protein
MRAIDEPGGRVRRTFRLQERKEELTLHVESSYEAVNFLFEGRRFRHSTSVKRTVPGMPLVGASAELRLGLENAVKEFAAAYPMDAPVEQSLHCLATACSTIDEYRGRLREWWEYNARTCGSITVREKGISARAPKWKDVPHYSLRLIWDNEPEEIPHIDFQAKVEDVGGRYWNVELVFVRYEKGSGRTKLQRGIRVSR